MEILNISKLKAITNPAPAERYKLDILTEKHGAKLLGGHMSTQPARTKGTYHYHERRESLILIISGEAVENVGGTEHVIKTGDVVYIGAGERHVMENRTDAEVRYLEFFTPLTRDVVQVNT